MKAGVYYDIKNNMIVIIHWIGFVTIHAESDCYNGMINKKTVPKNIVYLGKFRK